MQKLLDDFRFAANAASDIRKRDFKRPIASVLAVLKTP